MLRTLSPTANGFQIARYTFTVNTPVERPALAENDNFLDERRESWRTNLELPLKWCRLPGLVDADTLAEALGLQLWTRHERVMADLEAPLRDAVGQITDRHARTAICLLEEALRQLSAPDELDAVGQPTPVNLSADGMSFALPDAEIVIEPSDWLGVAVQLPDGYPLTACVEVAWVGATGSSVFVGGRFHHVQELSARKLARFVLLHSAH